VVCNLCGGSRSGRLFEHALLAGPLLKCPECGLVWVDFSETRDLIQDHQPPEDRDQAYALELTLAQKKLRLKDDLERAERETRKLNFAQRLRLINDEWARPRESARLLEVGCGEGFFLEQARRQGYSVIGVEPNARSSAFARRLGLEVVTGTLGEAGIGRDSADIMVALHVIEHLLDPSGEVSRMRNILRKDGLLVIETPNIDSLPFRILRKRWRQFIPVHYYFFSKKTIAALLARNGFAVSRIVDVGNRVSVRFFLNRLERVSSGPARLLGSTARALRLEGRTFCLNPLDLMLVFARKSD